MTTCPACADLATPARVIELLDDGMARVETGTSIQDIDTRLET